MAVTLKDYNISNFVTCPSGKNLYILNQILNEYDE